MSKAADSHYISAVDGVAILGEDGEQKLRLAAQEGKLTLLGRPRRNDRSSPAVMREPIPVLYFANPVVLNLLTNSFEGDAGGEQTDFAVFERNVAIDRWDDVVVARPQIEALKNSLASREAHSVAAEKRCLAWLTEQMLASPVAPQPKAAYQRDAKSRFSVGVNGFNRAWATAMRDADRPEWGKAGRKSRSKPVA